MSLTDIVTVGSTTVTSATGGFTTAMIGNGINIAGTCFEITARASTNSITVDRNTGTGTGQTGKVGGACKTQGYIASQLVDGNIVHAKAGTYTNTSSTSNVAGGTINLAPATKPVQWRGYEVTRGDNTGVRPIFQSYEGASNYIARSDGGYLTFDNIEFDGVNNSGAVPLVNSNIYNRYINCRFHNCLDIGVRTANAGVTLIDCEIDHCAVGVSGGRQSILFCYIHDCSTAGVAFSAGNRGNAKGCFFLNCAKSIQFVDNEDVTVDDCLSYGSTGTAFSIESLTASTATLLNCIAINSGGYGFVTPATNSTYLIFCAGYNNFSGNTDGHAMQNAGFITLSADPCNAAGSGDYSLNTAAGGGALLRGLGFPAKLAGLATTAIYGDPGPFQHQDAGGGLALPVARAI